MKNEYLNHFFQSFQKIILLEWKTINKSQFSSNPQSIFTQNLQNSHLKPNLQIKFNFKPNLQNYQSQINLQKSSKS